MKTPPKICMWCAMLCMLNIAGCGQPAPAKVAQDFSDARFTPEFAALKHMMDEHASASAREREEYSFYVVPASPVGDALIAEFPNYVPPLTKTIDLDTEHGLAIDRKTGRSVKLWDVGKSVINDDHAIVRVTWYSASLASAGYDVELKRVNGSWQVLNVTLRMIS